ncbi:CDGSH iron-sulfur domain-containing protein [Streptomyces sp. NPDC096013]|uniref:CDGSH iron-sulfur domain-containing protein n=1 Tax=Streptomyces sp. NPDC096013 TaxID=3366069 RepID=UPI00382BF23D
MPNASDRPRRVTVDRDGPVLVEGPVEIVREDGTIASSDRFVVAICTCRRSRSQPWCDTSHRRRAKPADTRRREGRDGTAGTGQKDTHDGDDH